MAARSKKLKPLIDVDELPSPPQRPTVMQMQEDLTNILANDAVLVSLPSNWQDTTNFDPLTIDLTEKQRNDLSDADILSLYNKAEQTVKLRSQINSLLDESSKNVSMIEENERNLKELASRIK
ncbi:hypothetical protein TrispH2_002560 [Trichoplax sp. H2]|uniref:Uncharacterized protein n=1 Tax=Trichoplax adhaerens TaxID=10228 RepID=B3RRB7_TRIAD|nr:hypothetical protein TRIADDRAFT_54177 [Trichoplax adhaerens]EDV26850.1 hypothetical protein TRIADDRAFT_54177 [Trichoplax adhaerens]RDD45236.1 hypothetical protein TrispH2_002560 [Trichoplax sp. H2]|eukprot:XP_002110846.1 hypothetical protein TRIADDRAFT_54177 [Trichoplax adhaerens]